MSVLGHILDDLWSLRSLDLTVLHRLARKISALIMDQDDQVDTSAGNLNSRCTARDRYRSAVWDTLQQIARSGDPQQRSVVWFMIDKLAKEDPVFAQRIESSAFFLLATTTFPSISTNETMDIARAQQYHSLLDSLSYSFGRELLEQIREELALILESNASMKLSVAAQGNRTGTAHIHSKGDEAWTSVSSHVSGFRVQQPVSLSRMVHPGTRSQRSTDNLVSSESMVPSDQNSRNLNKSTRSLLVVRAVGSLAPPVAQEMMLVQPSVVSDASDGHLAVVPTNHLEMYINERKSKLREIFKKRHRTNEKTVLKEPRDVLSVEDGLDLPIEYPRDASGVQIGNYPLGVRFLRDAIDACGGLVPLSRIEERIGGTDWKHKICDGSVRLFLDIHQRTFRIMWEAGINDERMWMVRTMQASSSGWTDSVRCQFCGATARRLRLPMHTNSRRCIGTQLMRGVEGEQGTPVMRLAHVAACIRRLAVEHDPRSSSWLEDGDLDDFSDALQYCVKVTPRLKYASERQFNFIVLSAVRSIRDEWCAQRQVNCVRDIQPFQWYERSLVRFFGTLGENLTCLPIPWLERGELFDLCSSMTTRLHSAPLPLPRPGDTRIRPGNLYPGFFLCDALDETETNEDDARSEDQEAYSDDEGDQVEWAPPVTVTQTIVGLGCAYDVQRLRYFLQTAPPPITVRRSQQQGRIGCEVGTQPGATSSVSNEVNPSNQTRQHQALPRSLVTHLKQAHTTCSPPGRAGEELDDWMSTSQGVPDHSKQNVLF